MRKGEPHQAGLFANSFHSELIPIAEYPFEEDERRGSHPNPTKLLQLNLNPHQRRTAKYGPCGV